LPSARLGKRLQCRLILLIGHLELRQLVFELEVGIVRHYAECERTLQQADRALEVAIVVFHVGQALQRERLGVFALAAIDDRLQQRLGFRLVALVKGIQTFIEILLILLAGQVELRLGTGRVGILHFLLGLGGIARQHRAAGHSEQQGCTRQHG
jgi:hypothetical protein